MRFEGAAAAAHSLWRARALALIVLVVAAGIVGMHALSGHESQHAGTTAISSVSHETASIAGHSHADPAPEAMISAGTGMYEAAELPCSSDCGTGVTAMCLAVLAVVLLMAHRLVSRLVIPSAAPAVGASGGALHLPPDRLRPDLIDLCVCRT